MNLASQNNWKEEMNELGKQKIPFLFIIDFLKKNVLVIPKTDKRFSTYLFQTPCFNNIHILQQEANPTFLFQKFPVSYSHYLDLFKKIQQALKKGDTFLCNLTIPTPIKTSLSLMQIFEYSKSLYKLYIPDSWVFFSPESFVQMRQGKIFTYPMKGTIDASLPNARRQIFNNKKEQYEHATIVDLLRNDLSRVAKNVYVNQYRFIQEVYTSNKTLLQMSSEIIGTLPKDYCHHLGDIFDALLPAGSICGAPKAKTLEWIIKTEKYDRKFYTGVFGYFDGKDLDSGVLIRTIEKQNDTLLYYSGGGITANSEPETEYQEMIDKIYVPIY